MCVCAQHAQGQTLIDDVPCMSLIKHVLMLNCNRNDKLIAPCSFYILDKILYNSLFYCLPKLDTVE